MATGDFSLLAYAGSWVVVTGGVWFLFERMEKSKSKKGGAAASRWLQNLAPISAVENWPATFGGVFDRIFGEKHVSWRCFIRSCIASLLAVLVMSLWFLTISGGTFVEGYALVGLIVTTAAIVNFVPDYLSLLETRYVIRWAGTRFSVRRTVAALAIDLAATVLIALIGIAVFVYLLNDVLGLSEIFGGKETTFSELVTSLPMVIHDVVLLYPGYRFAGGTTEVPLGISFYSTFFTSAWVLLFALAGFTLRAATGPIAWLMHFTDVKKQPFHSMGIAAMAIVTLLFLIGLPFMAF